EAIITFTRERNQLAASSLQRFKGTQRHSAALRVDAVDLRVGGDQVFHRLLAFIVSPVRIDFLQNLDTRLKSGLGARSAKIAAARSGNTAQHHDIALAAELVIP